jgi:glycosyltransferase involved in cell wall biosynthesis
VIDTKSSEPRPLINGVEFVESWNYTRKSAQNPFQSTLKAILFSITSAYKLAKIMNEHPVDLVQTHYSYSALTAAILCRMKRIPVVYTTHNPNLSITPSLTYRIKNLPESLVQQLATHIVAGTESVKRRLVSDFGVRKERLSVICMGPGVDRVNTNTSDPIRDKVANDTTILSVGRICRRKNQLILAQAAIRVLRDFPNARFILAGPIEDADYLNEIRDFLDQNGIADNFSLVGEVADQCLCDLYSNATAFVFPTKAEMQPLVLLEAMSFGVPVLASRIGPIMDFASIEPGSMILFSPSDADEIGDAIVEVLENPEMRRSLSASGRRLAMQCSWPETNRKYSELYRQLISGKMPLQEQESDES